MHWSVKLYDTQLACTRPSLAKEFVSNKAYTSEELQPETVASLARTAPYSSILFWWIKVAAGSEVTGGREENKILHWVERWKAKSTSVKETKQLRSEQPE